MAEDTKKEAIVAETKTETEEVKGEAKVEEKKEEAKDESKEEAEVEVKEEGGDVDETVEVPKEFKALVDQVEKMTVLELHELVKVLEKRFGVSASAVAVAGPAVAGDSGEEQTDFTVELTETGAQKIAVIKAIKEVLGLGLKEAKDMADGAPVEIKAGMKKEDAEALKAKLEEAGAKVTLK